MRTLVAALLAFGSAEIAHAGVRNIPLEKLVRDSAAIVTGEVVEEEQGEISPGVLQKTLSIRVGHVLKGQPAATALVRVGLLDGPNVPSGKLTFDLVDRGILFLYPLGDDARGFYQAAMRYDEGREKEVRKKLAALPSRPPSLFCGVQPRGFGNLGRFQLRILSLVGY